jgi:hypothetical protein
MAMQTNQSADPELLHLPELACRHTRGHGSIETCTYLRTIDRVRHWADRAERAHRSGQSRGRLLGELWLLFAEVQCAHDACPDHMAPAVPGIETHREAH